MNKHSFQLVWMVAGPMGSFGEYAGHEFRGSGHVPRRSAILGMVGAALGVSREDDEGQRALREYSVAVQSLCKSSALRDYHTVQTATEPTPVNVARREVLKAAGQRVNTTVTVREYRADVVFRVALWCAGGALWSLETIRDALRAPRYVLYIGRKSCPLAAPTNPTIVTARDPLRALATVPSPAWLPLASPGPVVTDPFVGGNPKHVEEHPSEPVDRRRWHFANRQSWYFERLAE